MKLSLTLVRFGLVGAPLLAACAGPHNGDVAQDDNEALLGEAKNPGSSEPLGFVIPGVIEAENFDRGGEGVAYHDTTPGNSGGAFRKTDVDIEAASEHGYDVGWIATGEWNQYTVNAASTGTFDVAIRVASQGGGAAFHLDVDGHKVASFTAPNTGGWQSWQTLSSKGISLTEGLHLIRWVAEGSSFNLNYFEFTSSLPSAPPQAVAAGFTNMTWHDEFDTLDLSPNGGGDHRWYNEFPWYSPAPASAFTVSNGILTVTGGEMVSFARDGSTSGNAFQWAYVEARIKFDPARSSQSSGWPAFWAFSSEHIRGTDVYNGTHEWAENDFFEAYNSPQGSYKGGWYAETMHDWVNWKNTQNGNNTYYMPSGTDMNQFHTYGGLWTPGKVTYYFDDKPGQSVTWQPGGTYSIMDKQHMALVIGTGNNWPAQVDWVRVWQK
jgi:hypothetical protein